FELTNLRMGWPSCRHSETVSKMIFDRGRSQLSEFYIANDLSLNSPALGFEKIFCFLQPPDQLFDLRTRWSANLLNKWRGIRVSFGLGRRSRVQVDEIAIFASGFHNTEPLVCAGQNAGSRR